MTWISTQESSLVGCAPKRAPWWRFKDSCAGNDGAHFDAHPTAPARKPRLIWEKRRFMRKVGLMHKSSAGPYGMEVGRLSCCRFRRVCARARSKAANQRGLRLPRRCAFCCPHYLATSRTLRVTAPAWKPCSMWTRGRFMREVGFMHKSSVGPYGMDVFRLGCCRFRRVCAKARTKAAERRRSRMPRRCAF